MDVNDSSLTLVTLIVCTLIHHTITTCLRMRRRRRTIVWFRLPRFVDRLRATGREATGSLHCGGQQRPQYGREWKPGGKSREKEELALHPNMRLKRERDGIWAVGSHQSQPLHLGRGPIPRRRIPGMCTKSYRRRLTVPTPTEEF